MTQDPRLKEIFPDPPLVAYKRPQNIRDKLIRSKIPQQSKGPKRNIKGMKKCNSCCVCPYIKEGKVVKATSSNYQIDINSSVDCSTRNVIYLLGCSKCPMQYIGETERMLKDRFREHKGYAITRTTNPKQQECISIRRDMCISGCQVFQSREEQKASNVIY